MRACIPAAIRRSADGQTGAAGVTWARGCFVVAPVTASERDLRALAAIVSQDRHDLPDGEEGLPLSLLADLKDQIRCDGISLDRVTTAGGKRIRSCSRSRLQATTNSRHSEGPGPGALGALLGLPLGVPVLQLSRAHRRPAQRRQTL